MSALTNQLTAALESRQTRQILRKLPSAPVTMTSTADFTSNDYLSFTTHPRLRSLFFAKLASAPHVLGSGGSRLLVHTPLHTALESRLARFFHVPAALLFNSGFDANAGFFASIPQIGDIVLYDEHIHASVHDGMRASRVPPSSLVPFAHNSLADLRAVLAHLLSTRSTLAKGLSSLFIAVESLYSMDGTFAPLAEIVQLTEELFPLGNAFLIVDEAHATGVYGPQGRGRVAQLGLESKVLMRLCTFGKALGGTGAVVLTNTLIRDYLLNYARSLIYTTSLSYTNIIAADCAFDLLQDGTAHSLAGHLLELSQHFTSLLHTQLTTHSIPPSLLSLPAPATPPSPIIPLHTPHARPLAAHLLALGINARPITWPTVPKGRDRVRVCLHAGNTREEVERLVGGVVGWARGVGGRWEDAGAGAGVQMSKL